MGTSTSISRTASLDVEKPKQVSSEETSETLPSPSEAKREDQANSAPTALDGNIMDYLIGRRRERIKTEKELLLTQKTLAKEVNKLQQEQQAKEDKIREVTAEKVELYGPLATEMFTKPNSEWPTRQPSRPTTEHRRRSLSANQLHGGLAPERIGHMLMATESGPASIHGDKLSPERAAQIETLNRAELLNMSVKIIVDGSSLRQIYESHLIGERGLRRLVAEHLRGGDLRKALRQEVVEREIDFERDPALRDMAPQQQISSANGINSAALNKLLEKVTIEGIDEREEAAFYKARAHYETKTLEQHQKQRRIVDFSIALTVAFLIMVIIALYLTRS